MGTLEVPNPHFDPADPGSPKTIVRDASFGAAQGAVYIAGADAGDLILVHPGLYDELVIMWKPVVLQGSGVFSTKINALPFPTSK